MDALDPFSLDRELARVARDWMRWRRKLRRGEGLDVDPFEGSRDATRRVTFDALGDLPESDPLRRPLRAWVYRLMEQRIDRAVLCTIASERAVERHVIDVPEHDSLTLAAMLSRALRERPRRKAWLSSYTASCDTYSSAVGLLWERRQEMASRLGLPHFDALDPSAGESTRAAGSWLDRSAELAREFRSQELADVIELGLGTDAARGWPARLSLRSLVGLFRETRLFDGLDLDTGELPEAVAASSFLRALGLLGAGFADALEPAMFPFVVACDPRGLRRRTLAALFATLPLSDAFLRRALDVGSALPDERRALARVILIGSRSLALSVLLRDAALQGRSALRRAFEEQSERALGVVVPVSLAGSLWRPTLDGGQRFAGLLLAAERASQLVEAHDEDWYRNPRAAEQLRAETALPPDPNLARGGLDAGLAALERWLAAALG